MPDEAKPRRTIEELRALITPNDQFYKINAGTRRSPCRSCLASVYWGKTPAGKAAQLDADVDGGLHPTQSEAGKGVLHFKTCPDAKMWSKKS